MSITESTIESHHGRNISSLVCKSRRIVYQATLLAFLTCCGIYLYIYDRTIFSSDKLAYLIDVDSYHSTTGPTIKRFSCSSRFKTYDDTQYRVRIDKVEYPQNIPSYLDHRIPFECLRNTSRTRKLILFWNKFYGDPSFYYGVGKQKPFIDNQCPVVDCETTNDKSRINDADLVVVSMTDSVQQIPPVSSRPANQRWIFLSIESPVHTRLPSHYGNTFNLVATYMHEESHFSNSYEHQGQFYWKKNDSFDENYDFSMGKLDQVAALISNCGAGTRRIEYINEMGKYISVQTFGRCGKSCPTESRIFKRPEDCKFIVGTEFKFYLAFENCICKDYITEKFFHMLRYNVIPVVLGGGNYSRYIPKSGYIDALDFDGPRQLAEYLLYLSNNTQAYNAYFKWKKHISFYTEKHRFIPVCDMCIRLHVEEHMGRKEGQELIKDLNQFHWSSNKHCNSVSMSKNAKGDLIYQVSGRTVKKKTVHSNKTI